MPSLQSDLNVSLACPQFDQGKSQCKSGSRRNTVGNGRQQKWWATVLLFSHQRDNTLLQIVVHVYLVTIIIMCSAYNSLIFWQFCKSQHLSFFCARRSKIFIWLQTLLTHACRYIEQLRIFKFVHLIWGFCAYVIFLRSYDAFTARRANRWDTKHERVQWAPT